MTRTHDIYDMNYRAKAKHIEHIVFEYLGSRLSCPGGNAGGDLKRRAQQEPTQRHMACMVCVSIGNSVGFSTILPQAIVLSLG